MKKTSFRHLSFFLAASVVASLLAPATAEARGRNVTVQGTRGGMYQRQISKTPGHYSTNRSATLPDGRTASRSFDTQRTDTGRTTTARATSLQGQTATYDSSRTRTDTGYVRDVAITGPDGGNATKQVNVSKHGGTVTRTVSTSATPAHP